LVSFEVIVDDKEIGSMVPGTFLVAVVNPGKHKIEVKAGFNSAKMNISTAKEKNYFYEAYGSGGIAVQPKLSIVIIEKMGKLLVTQSKLAKGSD
jgi:hypothetical protein